MAFDITGQTGECRFPWQRDVGVQYSPPSAPPSDMSGNLQCGNSRRNASYNREVMSDASSTPLQKYNLVGDDSGHSESSILTDACSEPSCLSQSTASGNRDRIGSCKEDDVEVQNMQQYTRSGQGRRPAVIGAYNFPGASSGTDIVTEGKDSYLNHREFRSNGDPSPSDDDQRGDHRANSLSALSRLASKNSSYSTLVSAKEMETKLKSKSLHSVLKIGVAKKKKSDALRMFLLHSYCPKEFGNDQLASYKKAGLADIVVSKDDEAGDVTSDAEMKKREAMWELFTNECTFLFDHLLVLRHCFMEPLKEAQVEGHLLEVDLPRLFGNLEDLCQISYGFCHDFIQSLRSSVTSFCSMDALVTCLDRMVKNSHNGEAYQQYVLKYRGAVSYLATLRQTLQEFTVYENFCSQDPHCNRLRLKDLLVAPMHHWTRLPMILKNVSKQTSDVAEKMALSTALQQVEASLRLINDKMKELKPLERVQEIQQLLVWPTITELDPKAFIPECLKDVINEEPQEVDLVDQRREIMHEGPLLLLLGEKERPADVYVFLLTDMLLMTKSKRDAKKKDGQKKLSVVDRTGNDVLFYVQKQPLPLEQIEIYDVKPKESSPSALRNSFAIAQTNCYRQTVAVITFQAQSEDVKMHWLESLSKACEKCKSAGSSRHGSFSKQFTAEEKETLARRTTVLTVEESAGTAARCRSKSAGGSSDISRNVSHVRGDRLTATASSVAVATAAALISIHCPCSDSSDGHSLTSQGSFDAPSQASAVAAVPVLFNSLSIDSGDAVFL